MQVLTDVDVQNNLTYAEAVKVMEQVFQEGAVGVPRWNLPFPEGNLIFTVGAATSGVGFRVYVRGKKFTHDDQLVSVWDRETAELKGVVVGSAIGVMRTGAIGGVAIKYCAPPEARTLALIGVGRQNYAQLHAIATVRPLSDVFVYSRTPKNVKSFCQQAENDFPNIQFHAAESAEQAVRNAEIIIAGTNSATPVLRTEWLKEGAHISTLGTKGRNFREVDEETVLKSAWIMSDSAVQTRDYPEGTILDGTHQELLDLTDIVQQHIPRPEGISLFLSTGLAGTEVALANYLFAKLGSP